MFPRSKDIFTCHWHGMTAKNTASIFTGCVYLLVWKRDVEVVFKKTAVENLEEEGTRGERDNEREYREGEKDAGSQFPMCCCGEVQGK